MLKELIHLANDLDSKGLRKEADLIDRIILKLSQENSNEGDIVEVDGVKWKHTGFVTDGPYAGRAIWEPLSLDPEGKKLAKKILEKGKAPASKGKQEAQESITGASTQIKNHREAWRQFLSNSLTTKQ